MPLVIEDRVRETTTVTGTNDATLLGAVTGFQAFSVIGNGNTTYYTISDQSGGNWEVGLGTYSSVGPTLARTTILSSSAGGSKVSFPAGTKDVFVTYPSDKAVYLDGSNNVQPALGNVVASQVNITAQGDLRLEDTSGGQYVAIHAPSTVATSYTLTLPVDDGTNGQALITDGNGVLSWSSAASGDVYGPASATDNAVALFDGTTGKIIKNSLVTVGSTGNTIISGTDNSNAMLRITQLGTGNALLVEDETNPDSTPFVINADGRVISGTTTVLTASDGLIPRIASYNGQFGTFRYLNDATANSFLFNKSRGTGTTQTIVQSGDTLGLVNFAGSDGTNFISSARIDAAVDGTPGTNDMPGRLVFSTTADGASSPTERMRIDSAGNVGIGTNNPPYQFSVSNGTSTVGFTPQATIAYAGTNTNHPFGLLTNNAERMRIDTVGNIGIGGATTTGYTLRINKAITGATFAGAELVDASIQSDVTGGGFGVISRVTTAASSFTLGNMYHFYVNPQTFGAGSTVTNQFGFMAESSITGATNNYGFYGNIASGTGRWNFFAAGTAANYMAGALGIGTTSVTDRNLGIGKNITGATAAYGVVNNGVIQSDVTSLSQYYRTTAATAAASFTLTTLDHFAAVQGTIGATSAVTTQVGFNVSSSLTGATNDYGFYGNLAAGTGIYNLYMAGTADNLLAGNLGIGANAAGNSLVIAKTVTGAASSRFVWASGSIASDVTTNAFGIATNISTQAASFTLPSLVHFYANQSTIGAGSTVTNQFGFFAESTLVGATNDYGFYGNIAAGTGLWNLYMNGTAQNYLAGNLGLGTTTPAVTLDVNKAGGQLRVSDGTVDMRMLPLAASSVGIAGTVSNHAYVLYTNNTERMRITAAGDVGIGTTSPGGKLDVRANTNGNNLSIVQNDSTGASSQSTFRINAGGRYVDFVANYTSQYFAMQGSSLTTYYQDFDTQVFRTNAGTERMRIDSSGNVGIGVTPSAWASGFKALQVNTASCFAGTSTRLFLGQNWYDAAGGGTYITTAAASRYDQLAGQHLWLSASSGTAGTGITFTQVLSIEKDKSLALQGTSPVTGVGVTFPATQSASSDANTLDDYEEGTFSPTISGWSGTYTTRKGFYTKVGRLVTLIGQVSTVAGTGTFIDYPGPANYPFAAGGYAGSYYNGTWAVTSGAQALPTDWLTAGPLDGPMNGNTSSFPNVFVANAVISNWTAAQCNAAVIFEIRFQVTYYT